jgi:hypothetical protein
MRQAGTNGQANNQTGREAAMYPILSDRFSTRHNRVLSNDDLRLRAPSIFADKPWNAVSDSYAFIPTITVVDKLRAEGFQPVLAAQSRTRIEGKGDFTKHMIRFRQASALETLKVGDTIPEIVLVNSHDCTSSYQVSAGLYRLVCSNGMVVSDGSLGNSIRTRHQGDIAGQVIDATYRIVEDFPALVGKVEEFKSVALPAEAQRAYAKSALMLRYDEDKSPLEPEQILRPRRRDDEGNSLWLTYQRVQENLMKGGLRGTYGNGRRQRTRAIASVNEDLRLNRALWSLTCEMEKLVR